VGDVQALGDRFQAGEFDDLGTLEGGDPGKPARSSGFFEEPTYSCVVVAPAGSEFRVFGIAVNSYATSRIGRLSNHNIEK